MTHLSKLAQGLRPANQGANRTAVSVDVVWQGVSAEALSPLITLSARLVQLANPESAS